ncbi:Inhibitor of nuclear factor kappa-B kinase subunit epsilon, partial [Apaloderma vittatum]
SQKSGELVAVKVFNNASYLRPQEVQMREFEMLRKLNHVNIVKLFAVEETVSRTSAQKPAVPTGLYCSSGSLLNVLEDPANAFGLAESEFLIVLQCVVAGMNHLRENGGVHRDIKPGNIMRLVGEDGQSIYKLTDFGAARELEDDEKFVSVYGTEEYLVSTMCHQSGGPWEFWGKLSPFLHPAAGTLPFVPFGGPRRNKEIMYKITSEKPSGAIAGVQRQENGNIEWSYELPVTCQLSTGLKDQLIPILANILEVDQEKCWGFDQFFAGTNDILHRIAVDVFSLQQASLHRIYIHSYNTTTKFLDAVFKQTNIVPHNQEYFFEGHLYELDPNLQAHNFCKTTEHNPLTLLSTDEHPGDVVGVRYRDPALDFPKFVPKVDVVADCGAAKSAVGAAHQTLRIARALRRCRELLARGLHWLIPYFAGSHRQSSLPGSCSRVFVLCEVADLWRTRPQPLPPHPQVAEELSKCSHNIFDFQGALDSVLSELVKHRQQVHEDK